MADSTNANIALAGATGIPTPRFVITDAGLAAASIAGTNPPGPYVGIVKWKVGSAFGYQPSRSDTDLNGSVLAQGVPLTYAYVGDNTINIVCRISAADGPFDFGEVSLWMANDVMFAKAAFESLQTKFSSLGSNVGSTYTFNCLIKLDQSIAVFQISTEGSPPDIFTVEKWSDLFPPSLMADPLVPVIRVLEQSGFQEPSLVTQVNDEWFISSTSYRRYWATDTRQPQHIALNSGTTFIDVAASSMRPSDLTSGSNPGAVNNTFVVKLPGGLFRSVNTVVAVNPTTYRLTLNPDPMPSTIPVGTAIQLYRDIGTNEPLFYSQIVDPPQIPLAANGTPGLAYGGTGTYMPQPGVIEAYGLLQSPSTNTGRILTSADDLNFNAWPSGWYTVSGATQGFPANLPVNVDGHLMIMSENPRGQQTGTNAINTTQVFYPAGNGGGDSNGVGGHPPYWREWNQSVVNSQGGWSNWFPFTMANKLGAPPAPTVTFGGRQGLHAGINAFGPFSQRCMWQTAIQDGGGGGQLTVASSVAGGQIVAQTSRTGGSGYGRWSSQSGMLDAGGTLSINMQDFSGSSYIVWYFF